jgi:hypothetical protein
MVAVKVGNWSWDFSQNHLFDIFFWNQLFDLQFRRHLDLNLKSAYPLGGMSVHVLSFVFDAVQLTYKRVFSKCVIRSADFKWDFLCWPTFIFLHLKTNVQF